MIEKEGEGPDDLRRHRDEMVYC